MIRKRQRRPRQHVAYVCDSSRREQVLRERVRQYKFRDHIIAAYRGEAGPLCDYLRSNIPLAAEHREQLADLIDQRIQRRQHGQRGPADPVPNPVTEAELEIASRVRQLKKQRYGDRRTPRGMLGKLIDEVCQGKDREFDRLAGHSLPRCRSRAITARGLPWEGKRLDWFFLIVTLTVAPAIAQQAPQPICGPARVVDGDGLVIGDASIRLFGIDAPETDQRCFDDKCSTYTCGIVARDRLSEHIAGRPVCCLPNGKDPYDRTVATCSVDGEDLNAWQVREGLALAYEKSSRTYKG